MKPRVTIVALGAANRRSLAYALARAGADVRFADEPREIAACDALVIPGVANVGYLADAMDRRALRAPILEAIAAGRPCLGICAGFQLFFEGSEEAPQVRGLGVFRGTVRRLNGPKSPHMGWNRVERDGEAPWAYFAHTYAPPAGVPDASAITRYGEAFASAGERGNLRGVQFHPERSGRYGATLLQRFVALASNGDAG
ncbi:MAG TPA: imidazole glycerol phosphate synthase subunit HisH [Candidatus Cybelea sp.]|nr:imidazole glycerol phosphate synthase subunit HisH [Candidatus Cybelea sp.]